MKIEEVKRLQLLWQIIALTTLSALIFIAYSNTFDVPFYLDDMPRIVENYHIQIKEFNFRSLSGVLFGEGLHGRPVAQASILLNYKLGGLEPAGWHIFNLSVHICSSVLLFFIVYLTIDGLKLGVEQRKSLFISITAALIWALHPVQVQAVTYVVQRMTSMAAMFYLSAMLAYIVGTRTERQTYAVAAYITCFLLWLLAMGTKQNSVTLPFTLLMYEYLVGGREAGSKKRVYVLGLLSLFLATLFAAVLMPRLWPDIAGDFELHRFTMGERLLTESRVFFFYLSLIFFPHPSRLNLDHDFILSKSFLDPLTTLLSLVLFFVLLIAGVILFKKRSLWGFANLWFIGHLLIESTILPLEIAFEHRLYLPSAGLIAVFVSAFLLRYDSRRIWISVCFVALLLLAATYSRNELWRDPIAFHKDMISKSPEKVRPWANFSNVLREAGDYEGAIYMAKRAIAAKHYEEIRIKALAYLSLGRVLAPLKRFEEARGALNESLYLYDKSPKTWHTLGLLDLDEGHYEEAIGNLTHAAKEMPGNYRVWGGLAAAAYGAKQFDNAIAWAQKSLELNPNDVTAMVTLGNTYFALSRFGEAGRYYSEAIDRGRMSEDVLNNRAKCWIRMGEYIRAREEIGRLLRTYHDNELYKETLCELNRAMEMPCASQ